MQDVPVKEIVKAGVSSGFFSPDLLIRTLSALVLMGVFGVFILVPPVRPLVLLSLLAGLWGEATLAFIRWRQGRTTGRCSPQTHLWAGWLILGAAWVVSGGGVWCVWRALQQTTLMWLTSLLVLIWTYDTGAYISGRVLKGPLLAPRLSPGKTWRGCVGGFFGVGVMYYSVIGVRGDFHALNSLNFLNFPPTLISLVTVLLGILIFCVLVQGGDLAESGAKRFFGLKDSSTLIPGHGGLWDRLDSTLFVFCALWIATILVPHLNFQGLMCVGY